MAVYTKLNREQISQILKKYNIGEYIDAEPIKKGIDNSNYLIKTTKNKYILTIFEKRISPKDVPFFVELMQFLKKKNIPCPQPIPDKNNKSIQKIKNKPALIASFLDGAEAKKITQKKCALAGEKLAQMHLRTKQFNMKRKNDLNHTTWRKLIEKNIKKHKQADQQKNDIEADLDHIEKKWPKNLPIGVIHADFFPDNVFFNKNKLSGIIDFYFACNEILAYELAICINAWCFDKKHQFNKKNAAAFLNAYHKVKPLNQHEQNMFPILAKGAAMRYLATRLHDWFHTPKTAFVTAKDPNEYIKKLKFHRNMTSIEDYGFKK